MQWNGVSHCKFDRKSMETETPKWSGFPHGGKVIVKQTLAQKKERNCKAKF